LYEGVQREYGIVGVAEASTGVAEASTRLIMSRARGCRGINWGLRWQRLAGIYAIHEASTATVHRLASTGGCLGNV
jgi:hypothetical protein